MNQPGGGEPPPGSLLGEAEPAAYAGRKTPGGGVAVNTRGVAVMEAKQQTAVTFGWEPRCLQSAGQYHKGGPPAGVFLQITGAVTDDAMVPGQPYTLGRLQLAQALGDLGELRQLGRPVIRLHLRDRQAGVAQLLAAATAASSGDAVAAPGHTAGASPGADPGAGPAGPAAMEGAG